MKPAGSTARSASAAAPTALDGVALEQGEIDESLVLGPLPAPERQRRLRHA
ncbi:MAG: hypothetical protein ACREKG_16000 [Candidatus Rokuibacteriota bacterium]